jgi:beta-lactamase superfamily II metal-dependent hydrolase
MLQRLLFLAIVTAPAAVRGGQTDGKLDVYWTDVEGGAATLIVTPAGESILIDTGLPGERDPYRIYRTVTQRAGLDRIDHLIITHFDVDHFGGAADLSELIFIDKVWDPGIPKLGDRRKEMIQRYRRAFRRKRTVLKPGDRIPLRAARGRGSSKLELICLGAARKFVEAPTGAPANPTCAQHTREKKTDTSQNGESTALLLRFGDFELLDCGDLTWQLERELVCPVNLVGKVDVFQVDHHGLDQSNNPVLVDSVEPRVAIMNNGFRKGCMPEVFATLTAKGTSIEAIYQMHRNLRAGPEGNTAPELIANHEKDCTAEIIKLSVHPNSKTYSVEIPSSGHIREFATR